jgi:uncharacterized protein
MKLENEFTVDVPVEDVWDVLLDLERITPCLPGASLTEETGEREYEGAMKVKLGPVTQQYKGTVQIQEADESAHRAVLKADGKDARGQGTASATITSTLHDEGEGSTRVMVETDMQITGRAAQFGQGIQQQVSEKLLSRFADCLEEEIVNGGAARDSDVTEEAPSANGSSGEGQPSPGAAQQEDEVEALDLGEASQDAILQRVKPAIPLVVGVVALVLVIRLLRRGGSSGGRSGGGRGEIEAHIRF